MNTDDLIVHLARVAGPVRPLRRPAVRLVQWAGASVLWVAAAVVIIGPRKDVMAEAARPAFAAAVATTAAAGVLAAAGALVLGVPGAERSWWPRAAPAVAAAAWVLALGVRWVTADAAVARALSPPFHAACVAEIVGLGAPPAWALVAMLRRAAPLRYAWSAGLAAAAGVGLAALAAQFVCPIDDPIHHLVSHVGPVAVSIVLSAGAGRRWLA